MAIPQKPSDYAKSRKESDKLLPQQKEIIQKYYNRLDFSRAECEHSFKVDNRADMGENTDLFYFEYHQLRIACRTRFDISSAKYGDITIRCRTKTGRETELDKINAGFGDYMLYCWGTRENIDEFVIIDLAEFRKNQDYFIKNRKETWNDDGSAFYAYDLQKIVTSPCCVVANLKSDK